MNSKRRKALILGLAAVMIFGTQLNPFGSFQPFRQDVYAGANASATMVGDSTAMQGEQGVTITMRVVANSSFTFNTAVLEFSDAQDITAKPASLGTITMEAKQSMDINFTLDIGRSADTGVRQIGLTLKNGSAEVYSANPVGSLTIFDKTAAPSQGSGSYLASLDMVHSISPSSGFAPGQSNTLSLEIINSGNTLVKNVQANLTLPDGLTVDNASSTVSLGYISNGKRAKLSFPITVEDDAKSKNYPITVELSGLDHFENSFTVKKTIYVPVNGSGTSVKNAAITNINIPNQVYGQDDFTLSFDVQNQNKADLKNVKVNVEVPEGLLNKTRSTFIESVIPGASSKNYSVTLSAADGAKEKAYPLKITVSSSTAKDDSDSVLQYASVYVNGTSGEKTPQLMVDNYSYGGTYVQAGDSFVLDLGLYNTSSTHTITNIKVTVSSEDGTFIPVNSSNSFFVDKLAKKAHADQSLCLAVKPAAEQKTTSLTVDMAYEDGAGNAFTSKDIISIPVMQETRLAVDDIVAPPELYPGMQTGLSVQFYNMGKTTLNNLRVSAEGDFDTQESTSYYVGNMESGKSDSYDFSFIPRQAGSMTGKLTFTYEDAAGNEQTLEKPFTFQVMEQMPTPDDGTPQDDQGGKGAGKLPWIIGGVAVWLVAIGIIVFKKLRKKKKLREMEIDE